MLTTFELCDQMKSLHIKNSERKAFMNRMFAYVCPRPWVCICTGSWWFTRILSSRLWHVAASHWSGRKWTSRRVEWWRRWSYNIGGDGSSSVFSLAAWQPCCVSRHFRVPGRIPSVKLRDPYCPKRKTQILLLLNFYFSLHKCGAVYFISVLMAFISYGQTLHQQVSGHAESEIFINKIFV